MRKHVLIINCVAIATLSFALYELKEWFDSIPTNGIIDTEYYTHVTALHLVEWGIPAIVLGWCLAIRFGIKSRLALFAALILHLFALDIAFKLQSGIAGVFDGRSS